MKRAAVFLMALGLAFGLDGCGKGDTGAGENTLVIWESYNNEEHRVFDEMAREPFEKWYQQKTGKALKLVLGRVPFDGLLPKLKTACQTKTTPDICRVDVAQVVQLAYGQAIVPLDELPGFGGGPPDKLRREYVPAAYDSNLIDVKSPAKGWTRHLYGVPDQTNCVALFYNKRLFRESAERLTAAGCDPARPPATWDEFVKYARALSIPSKRQFGFGMDNSLWWTLPFFNSFGATFVEKDAAGMLRCSVAEPAAVTALKFKIALYQDKFAVDGVETRAEAGAWVPGSVSTTQGFANSSYAMVLSGPWNIENFKGARDVELGVAMVPAGPKGSSSTTGGSNLVIFRSCKNQDAAYDFLRFVTSADFQQKWASRLGQIPVRADVMDKIDLSKSPELAVFYKQMLHAEARPGVPGYDRLEELLNPEMELALKGDKTAEQALKDAAAAIDKQVLAGVNEL